MVWIEDMAKKVEWKSLGWNLNVKRKMWLYVGLTVVTIMAMRIVWIGKLRVGWGHAKDYHATLDVSSKK